MSICIAHLVKDTSNALLTSAGVYYDQTSVFVCWLVCSLHSSGFSKCTSRNFLVQHQIRTKFGNPTDIGLPGVIFG